MQNQTRIGLAVNHSYAYYRNVLRGVVRYAEARPQWLFRSIDPGGVLLEAFDNSQVAGLIASIHVPEFDRAFAQWRQPVVNVSAVLPGLRFPRVGVDNVRVGQMAAEHFLERGLRHFGFVGPPDHVYSIERHTAFCQALEDSGHAVAWYHAPANLPFDAYCQRWSLGQDVYDWLQALPKPVGVFTPSDVWGVEVSEACRQIGLRVPEDVALLGVDDDDLDCQLTRPRLSSVIIPAERIGYEAAALLDRLLAGEPPPAAPILTPPTGVATRRSTEVLAIDDDQVIAAVRFIREHSHLPLCVGDVLREVALGRRALEKRCRAALGRGVGEEIRRAHLLRAQRLLARTELPLKSVAQQSGFSSFRYMADVFRQQLDETPGAYRRRMRGEGKVFTR